MHKILDVVLRLTRAWQSLRMLIVFITNASLSDGYKLYHLIRICWWKKSSFKALTDARHKPKVKVVIKWSNGVYLGLNKTDAIGFVLNSLCQYLTQPLIYSDASLEGIFSLVSNAGIRKQSVTKTGLWWLNVLKDAAIVFDVIAWIWKKHIVNSSHSIVMKWLL